MATTTASADRISEIVKPGRLLIGGEWVDSESSTTLETINPATGEVITTFAEAGASDVDRAVSSARSAFEGKWSAIPAARRGKYLATLADLILEHGERLASLETSDNGKPFFESSKIDIPFAANVFRYFSGWADKLAGQTIPARGDAFTFTRREPLGVVAQIIPWNLPLVMCAWKLAPALAAGNTVVLKPAEQTPLTALALGELIIEAGFPPGVVNILTGRGEVTGAALVKHPGVDKISFTGSVPVGKEIMRNSAENLTKLTLELGGKSPNIIFADANMKSALRGAINGIFYGKGELCCAGSRLLVERSCYDDVVSALQETVSTLQVGDPFDKKTRIGALVSHEQTERVLKYIEIGKSEGAKLVTGGERVQFDNEFANGCFVSPTVFADVDNSMTIAQEEIFGPALAVIPFDSEEDALTIANDTEFGLAAALWTNDIKRAHRMAAKLKAGTVWVNTVNMFDASLPFGGFKHSGFGRDLGEDALDGYLQTKSVWIDLND